MLIDFSGGKYMIISNKARCMKCDTIIESLHRHDFKACPCGSLIVDGGTDYIKRCGDPDFVEELNEFRNDDCEIVEIFEPPAGASAIAEHTLVLNKKQQELITEVFCKINKWECEGCDIPETACDNIIDITIRFREDGPNEG